MVHIKQFENKQHSTPAAIIYHLILLCYVTTNWAICCFTYKYLENSARDAPDAGSMLCYTNTDITNIENFYSSLLYSIFFFIITFQGTHQSLFIRSPESMCKLNPWSDAIHTTNHQTIRESEHSENTAYRLLVSK